MNKTIERKAQERQLVVLISAIIALVSEIFFGVNTMIIVTIFTAWALVYAVINVIKHPFLIKN
jgi:membrane protein YdbS with pleckstrin-like domain